MSRDRELAQRDDSYLRKVGPCVHALTAQCDAALYISPDVEANKICLRWAQEIVSET